MAMIIKNNMSALNTLNKLNENAKELADSLKKVSSGMKINSAGDDASGYAISERMRVQMRGLSQDISNTQTGVSMLKVAEGGVQSTVDILKTLKEKAINAANDTNTDIDRATIQKEVDQSIDQIDVLIAQNDDMALGAIDAPASYFAEVRDEYIARRDFTIERLNEIPGLFSPKPEGAFYTVAQLPVADAEDFARWMLTDFSRDGATTMVTPAASFYKTPGAGRNHVRIAYVLEVPALRQALSILAEGLETYQKLHSHEMA